MSKQDGGPAFPRAGSDVNYDAEGMSLRDWFAGQALTRMDLAPIPSDPDTVADWMYRIADAMLAARRGQEEGTK